MALFTWTLAPSCYLYLYCTAMVLAPFHAQPFLTPAIGGVDVPGTFGPNHPLWSVECPCGARVFDVLASELPRYVARCTTCARELVLYDVRVYPAATVIPASDDLQPVARSVEVFVMYEYPERDEGEPFDPDDISWCEVFARPPGERARRILDDETA